MTEYPYLSQALSKTIESFRKERRLTKSLLAEFSCLERRYLREIELGTKKPTLNAIYSISDALQITPLQFFTKLEEERQKLAERGAFLDAS